MKKQFIALLISVSAAPAFAILGVGDIVFDPANIVQTTITAGKAVIAEAYQIKQRLRELDQLSHMDTSAMSDLADEKLRLQDLSQVLSSLKGQLEKEGDINKTYQSMYGASNAATPAEFAALLKRRQDAGDAGVKSLSDQSKAIAKSIEASSAQHQQIADSLPNVAGVTEAAQLTATSVGVVIQQLQTANAAQAVMLENLAAKEAKQNAQEQEAKRLRIEYVNNAEQIFKSNQLGK